MSPKKQRPSVAALDHSGITKERREQVLNKFSSGSSTNPQKSAINVNRVVSNDSAVSTGSVEPDLSNLIQLNGDAAPIAESYSLDDQPATESVDPSAISLDGPEPAKKEQARGRRCPGDLSKKEIPKGKGSG